MNDMNRFAIIAALGVVALTGSLMWMNISLSGEYNRLLEAYERCTGYQPAENITVDFNFTQIPQCVNEIIYTSCNTPTFMQISEEIGSRDYNITSYNCEDFTRDAVYALRGAGWDVRRVQGYYYNNGTDCPEEFKTRYDCRHVWGIVQVPVEFTTGEVIEPDIYDQYYSRVRK